MCLLEFSIQKIGRGVSLPILSEGVVGARGALLAPWTFLVEYALGAGWVWCTW
jgi:hypothetical protein